MTEQEIRELIAQVHGATEEMWAMGAWAGWLAASTVLLGLRLAMLIRTKGKTSW